MKGGTPSCTMCDGCDHWLIWLYGICADDGGGLTLVRSMGLLW